MDNVNIYYDGHSLKGFLEVLPVAAFTFTKVIKLFYDQKEYYERIFFRGEKCSKYSSLEEFEKIIKINGEQVELHDLLRVIYVIHYLANQKSAFTHLGVAVELYSSYKSISMIPNGLKRFDGSMPIHEKKKFQVFQLEFLDKVISLTDPSHISTTEDQFCPFENPKAEYEYVKDPYWLAVEFMRIEGENHKYEDIIDKKSDEWNLLQQIKELITVEEILEICYKYAKPDEGYYIKHYPETGGIARFSIDNYTCHYPRFFIREELRRRGVTIQDGNSERDMKSRFGKAWKEEKDE